ncbi:hypothetical protein CVT25_013521 [Psilocybe cyanescens]|uniref:Uncharacterized protein n=1 Tax=Psilocybe cyanescens TaxID=93625 RepID=A0A409XSL6_PSICY|nr:hypothetical protein CVT25_013521 [Psilocybe cyanescens]
MPQQPESAARIRICKVDETMVDKKIRVAGRVIAYNSHTGLAVLLDGKFGLLVDTDLSLDEESSDWATERLATVVTMGHLERSEQPLAVPLMPAHAPPVAINRELVLRAILIVRSPDLDLKLWNSVLEEEEEYQESKVKH